jgi:hypothetical protein
MSRRLTGAATVSSGYVPERNSSALLISALYSKFFTGMAVVAAITYYKCTVLGNSSPEWSHLRAVLQCSRKPTKWAFVGKSVDADHAQIN